MKTEKEHRKTEFDWVVDEWVVTEYGFIDGVYHPIDCIRGLSLDDIIRMI